MARHTGSCLKIIRALGDKLLERSLDGFVFRAPSG